LLHYQTLGRLEAMQNLAAALDEVERRIVLHQEAGLPAPRPYPWLARRGHRWVKAGRYQAAIGSPTAHRRHRSSSA
jgi:hypothetical protein